MTPQDRQLVLDAIAASNQRLCNLAQGLTLDQWNFREAPERWTIGENIEHVSIVDERILGIIARTIAEAAPQAQPPAEINDDVLMERLPDRSVLVVAPEATYPAGKWATPAQAIDDFLAGRENVSRFVRETEADLRAATAKHGRLGQLDCFQWVLCIPGHTERHARQIETIMANPAYPKD